MAIVSRGQLGGGDIKLFALIGAAVGWEAGMYVMLFTYLLAALYAIPVWVIKKWVQRTTQQLSLPMAPFIAGGTSILLMILSLS